VTLALHVAPGEVTATSVALAPCLIDAGRLVIRTERAAPDEVLGCALGLLLGCALGCALG
jgi:hypothetical protein